MHPEDSSIGIFKNTTGYLICGRITNKSDKYIAPTLLANVSKNSKIKSEETFS